jgi:uncharacterized OB-fold protein
MSATSEKARVPVLDGWFSAEGKEPHLIGSRCEACGTYYFPKLTTFCRNPDCNSEKFVEVPLSRTGKLWSYTNAAYKPPEPYIAAEPFEPFGIAAVELDKERMVVLGQLVKGVNLADLKVGMAMELVIDVLSEDETAAKTTWKWKPAGGQA